MRLVTRIASVLLLLAISSGALASDSEELNELYRMDIGPPYEIGVAAAMLGNNIVSDGLNDEPLIVGKREMIVRSIQPFARMIDNGLQFERTTYITRRLVSGDIAHDVGYFHSTLSREGVEPIEVVQKFSVVFMKERGEWKIVTYFDAGTAPLDVLRGLEARYVIH